MFECDEFCLNSAYLIAKSLCDHDNRVCNSESKFLLKLIYFSCVSNLNKTIAY